MEYQILSDLKYTKSHEWVRLETNTAVMGITDYAQHQLSDVVYIEMPQLGDIFEKGSLIGEIESVKAVSEFYMPLSGEILEINNTLVEHPEFVNSSPYKEGWLVKIKINDLNEIDSFLTANQYKELIQKEENQ